MSDQFSLHSVALRIIAVLASALIGVSPLGAQQQTRDQGALVLRNGNILTGVVQQVGDHYRVENAGAVLQVPSGQVETVCASMNDAYEQRRQQRVGSSADSHLELARWCLRHRLLPQAAREILDARTKDPGHPALRSLDLQLQQGIADEASRRRREAEAAQAAQEARPEPLAVESAAERLIDPSPHAQEQFVRSIQPMLIHSCTTSGCHQPDSRQQLKLDRWALEGSGSPALIRRNLRQVLAHVNPDDPPSSSIMRRARQPHGYRHERLSTPLAPYQAALLMEWLNDAAGIKLEQEPVVDPSAQPSSVHPSGDENVPLDDLAIEAALLDAETSLYGPAVPRTLNGQDASIANRALKPRDPFDPEVFNRRRAAKMKADAETRRPATIEPAATAPASVEASADLPAAEPSKG